MVKVERTFPAPASLAVEAQKKNGSYDKADVIEQLSKVFHNKCYICEMKNLQDPQVEHLLPHKKGKYPERKFDWNNLFWSCGHCNGVKNKEKYDEGILDCCKSDPEELINFRFRENDIDISARKEANDTVKRTISLVEEVFTQKNTGMRVYTSDMRLKELKKEMNVLYDNLEQWKINPDSKVIQRKIRALLRRESAFAAFKRSYIRDYLSCYPEFQEYIA